MATLYVSDSQGAVYARDESDEEASNIFAAERRSTLISVAKRDELIDKQGAFLSDLLELYPHELRYNLALQRSMLRGPVPDTPAPD
jgi:CRP-like cAMP-binding protein